MRQLSLLQFRIVANIHALFLDFRCSFRLPSTTLKPRPIFSTYPETRYSSTSQAESLLLPLSFYHPFDPPPTSPAYSHSIIAFHYELDSASLTNPGLDFASSTVHRLRVDFQYLPESLSTSHLHLLSYLSLI
jgi:hypothetical protein